MNVGSWLASAYHRMSPPIHSEPDSRNSPWLDVQVLIAHILNQNRAWVFAHPEYDLLPQQTTILDELLNRYLAGEPLPYILGEWEFYSLSLVVSPAVLIPRPETELLVEEALHWLNLHTYHHTEPARIADVGTGSGCIAVSLAVHHPNSHIIAVDISRQALDVACINIKRRQLQNRVSLVQGNLLNSLSGPFDLVCANLPYIPSHLLAGLCVAEHEPCLSLDGGVDGLDFIRALLSDAPRWVSRGGLILLEIEANQGSQVCSLVQDSGLSRSMLFDQTRIKIIPDLSGNPRVLRIET